MVVSNEEVDGDVPPRNEEHRAMVVVHDDIDGFKEYDEAGDIHDVSRLSAAGATGKTLESSLPKPSGVEKSKESASCLNNPRTNRRIESHRGGRQGITTELVKTRQARK